MLRGRWHEKRANKYVTKKIETFEFQELTSKERVKEKRMRY